MTDDIKNRFFWGIGTLYAAANLWTTVLLWQVLAQTHSALWLAGAVAAGTAPTVVVGMTGPEWGHGGTLSQWLLGLGLALGGLSFAMSHSAPLLILAALFEGWFGARIIPLSQTLLMAHIPASEAPRASSRYELASRIGIVAGPLLGGLALTAIGPALTIVLTAVLFLMTGALFIVLPADFAPTGPQAASASARIADSWRAIRDDRFLVAALGVRAGSNLLWPAFTVAGPLLVQGSWHAHAIGYGAMRTVWGVSTVLGTILVVPFLIRRLKTSYFLSWLITGTAFLAIGMSPHLWEALMWTAIGAVSSPVVHVALDSHIGMAIPPAYRSAVFAIQRLVMAIVNLAGLGLMTGALNFVAPGEALGGAGILMILFAAVGLSRWRSSAERTGTVGLTE